MASRKNVPKLRLDVISKSPGDLISRIMKYMPLRDAAMSSMVSRKWSSSYKEIPGLRFDSEFFAVALKSENPEASEFYRIVSDILLSHVGHIEEFFLEIPKLESMGTLYIGPCISFLSRNHVKQITIRNGQNSLQSPLLLSHHLFSCLSLEKLIIEHCVINFPPFFKVFKNLLSIEFVQVTFTGNLLNDFVVNCPLLESLTLKSCTGFERMHITAPNLQCFYASGNLNYVHVRSQNLIAFSITMEKMAPRNRSDWIYELLAYLAQSCKIERMSLGGYFFKSISMCLTKDRLRRMLLTNYRFLKALHLSKIQSDDKCSPCLVILMIQSCPIIEELKVAFSSVSSEEVIFVADRTEFACLRKVEFTSVKGVSAELKLIELLLACSPALETMHIERKKDLPDTLKVKMTQELLYFRRASSKAVVICKD